MKYSFESDGETITLTHLPGRQFLYLRSGAFKLYTASFNYWKKRYSQSYSIPFGGNGRQIFGKELKKNVLDGSFCKVFKQTPRERILHRPPVLAPVFKMENGETTAMLYEYIVSFTKARHAFTSSEKGKFEKLFRWSNLEPIWKDSNCYLVKATREDLPSYFEGLKILQGYYDDVEFAHPNFVGLLSLDTADPNYQQQWAINPNANVGGKSPAITIDLENAWNQIGNTVLTPTPVMVLDQGIFTHLDLQFQSISSTSSSLSHGIKVAGVMGALQNSIGITGISPNPGQARQTAFDLIGQNFPGQFDSNTTEQMAVDQATWVRDFMGTVRNASVKPKVLNLSFNFVGYPGTKVLKTVLTDLSKDMLICVSSGNFKPGTQNTGLEDVPGYPAYLPNIVLPVGAIDITGRRATVANHGWASKYGFAGGIGLMAPGVDIITTDKNGAYYPSFSGTSTAVAFVSGIAALLFAVNKNPNMKPNDLRQILLDTATTTGLVAAPSLSSNVVGKGIVRAGEALKQMLIRFP